MITINDTAYFNIAKFTMMTEFEQIIERLDRIESQLIGLGDVPKQIIKLQGQILTNNIEIRVVLDLLADFAE